MAPLAICSSSRCSNCTKLVKQSFMILGHIQYCNVRTYMADNDPHGMRLIVCKFYSHSIHSYVHAGRQSSVIQMITKEPFHLLVCRTAAASTAGWLLLLLLLLLLSIYNIFIFLPTDDLTLATPPRPLWDFNLLVNIISHRLLN